MARIACIVIGGVVLACAACVEDDAECNGFGCPSSADAGESATTASASSSDATSDDDVGPTTLESSGTATTTTTTTTTDPSATSDADDTTASPEGSSSDTDDDTTGPCPAACPVLGECFGVGVWQSCTQYCEASKATCVEAGCGGATVVYYGDANACVDMQSNGESDQSCDAAFDQGGGVSFGRCCCE